MLNDICRDAACWDATGSMLQGWGAFAGAAAVAYAAYKAADTFRNFRKQKAEERRMDAAEQIIKAVYVGRDALTRVRAPLHWAGELETAEAELIAKGVAVDKIPQSKAGRYKTAQVVLSRLKANQDDLSQVIAQLASAKAIFGAKVVSDVENFARIGNRVGIAAQGFPGVPDNEAQSDIYRAALFEGFTSSGTPNEMDVAIDRAITSLEAHLLPVIRGEEHLIAAGPDKPITWSQLRYGMTVTIVAVIVAIWVAVMVGMMASR